MQEKMNIFVIGERMFFIWNALSIIYRLRTF